MFGLVGMAKSKNIFHNLVKPFKFTSTKKNQDDEREPIAAQEQKIFKFQTLVSATKNFHPNHKLGQGGYGPVFKGKLEDGREIAVKKLSQSSSQGNKEFTNEAKLLARVQHRNVVNLLGYCGNPEKLLVYEYVVNESLDKLLFESKNGNELSWKRRYDIICGVARGLLYLHEDSHDRIIHRDIKASNILLDEKWIPKIADFGMARLFPEDQTNVNTRVAGTNGYMAPEYVMHGNLSVKVDVYSFGVVVLELVSGQRNSGFNLDPECQNLLDWAYKLYKKGKSLEILESTLASSADPDQVSACIQIALLCTQSDPKLRPTMRRVVVMLTQKSSALDEPTLPGIPGTQYRRSLKPDTSSSSTAGTSSTLSSHNGQPPLTLPSYGQPPQAEFGQPPMAQYATGVPPQPMVSYGKWSTGLCGCGDDVSNCCITCWCPCITFGQIAEIVDKGATSCAAHGSLYTLLLLLTGRCQCIYSCMYRSKMRQQYRLKDEPCNDCLVHCCCEPCALCQEYRELKNRGFVMSLGWDGNSFRGDHGDMRPRSYTGWDGNSFRGDPEDMRPPFAPAEMKR